MEAMLGLVFAAVMFVIWLARQSSQDAEASYDAAVGEVLEQKSTPVLQGLPQLELPDGASAAIHICSELIGFQLRAACCNPHTLAQDRWALGYIWGFVDGVMQRMRIDTGQDRSIVHRDFFSTLFTDSAIGAALFALAVRSQGLPEFETGANNGSEDVFQASDTETPRFGLSEHFFDASRARAPGNAFAASQDRVAPLAGQRKK
jgi:hypothetical protein